MLFIGFIHSPNRGIDAQSQFGIDQRDEREMRIQRFEPAKKLLQEKGVPFEPEAMLQDNWKEELAPLLDQIPDMHISRAIGNRMEGVQMADALYLPEKVKLTGDTIIIARKIVFEGHNAVLKGPHNIYYFPLETDGVLGMNLDAAVKQQMRSQSSDIKSDDPDMLKSFNPQLLKKDWTVTIDSSGYGWQDWLEDQKEKELGGVAYGRDTYQLAGCDGNNNCNWTPDLAGNGRDGDKVDYQAGLGGDPAQADPGIDDACVLHPTSLNPDFSYLNGEDGDPTLSHAGTSPNNSNPDHPALNPGGKSAKGGTGIRGGDAGNQMAEIYENGPGNHFFIANGGQGGQGGTGGQGSKGGKGQQGGNGMNGLNCNCAHGGAAPGGDGGAGAPGGKGGTGGDGGDGGDPGDAGLITLYVPATYSGGKPTNHEDGGKGGLGGIHGVGGEQGQCGGPGNIGLKAVGDPPSCSIILHDGYARVCLNGGGGTGD